MGCGPPSLINCLIEWWGVDGTGCGWGFAANFSAASNVVVGNNPLYQVDDFLAFYPKFATQPQGILTATPNVATPGSGYLVNDVLNVAQPDAAGGQVKVASVGGGGAPTSYLIQAPGTGYSVAAGLATTGGTGTGAKVDIASITVATGYTPQAVIQAYIALATASLQQARWQDQWMIAMHLFVAHYCTLWLGSEGNPVSSAGQAAITGMGKGIAVSKAAGDVSVSYDPQVDPDFTSWNLTTYGQQLAAMAKVIGMGMMYVP